jgi:hypothetical protein
VQPDEVEPDLASVARWPRTPSMQEANKEIAYVTYQRFMKIKSGPVAQRVHTLRTGDRFQASTILGNLDKAICTGRHQFTNAFPISSHGEHCKTEQIRSLFSPATIC